MNKNTTPIHPKSHGLCWFAREAQIAQVEPTRKEIEELVNTALKDCVNAGLTPMYVYLQQPKDYLRLIVTTVDGDAPQAVKQAFLENRAGDKIEQEA